MNKTSAILQLSTSVTGRRNAISQPAQSPFRCLQPKRERNSNTIGQKMGLFDFFKKTKEEDTYKLGDSLIPKSCSTEVSTEIVNKIQKINWSNFDTAYGNAERTIPFYLKNLFCTDKEIAMDATHQLWCSLCHQHAYISSAALPSYEILKLGLFTLDDDLKIELLDIFQGFSACTSDKYFASIKQSPSSWELELKQKLIFDIDHFKDLTSHSNEEIVNFASTIIDDLTNKKII